MSTIEKHNSSSLSAREQVEALSDMLAPGATPNELAMIAATAERLGLDLLGRQVYAVKRYNAQLSREAWTVQVSIDGFRLIAERSGRYTGQVGPFWCGQDGAWRDVWLDTKPPRAARVGVLRRDFTEPCWAVALYDEYVQKKRDGSITRMWSDRPALMLAKCAESLALRKSFPQELSGVYTSDELPAEIESTIIQPPDRPALAPARVPEQPVEPPPPGAPIAGEPEAIVADQLAAIGADGRKRIKAFLRENAEIDGDQRQASTWINAIIKEWGEGDPPPYTNLAGCLAALDRAYPPSTPLSRQEDADTRADKEAEGLFENHAPKAQGALTPRMYDANQAGS
jgi:phage recombination protein Bet